MCVRVSPTCDCACDESHTWTSHDTHVNKSCHTHEQVMAHTCRKISTCLCARKVSHTWTSHETSWTSHITHINESCHTHERVMTHTFRGPRRRQQRVLSHTQTSLVTHMNESCHTHLTHERVISHTRTSLTHMNESWHTHSGKHPHNCAQIEVPHTNESCHTHGRVMARTHQEIFSYYAQEAEPRVSWLTHEWIMAHMNESWHIDAGKHPHDCAQEKVSHTWTSHGTHLNESWHIRAGKHLYDCAQQEDSMA